MDELLVNINANNRHIHMDAKFHFVWLDCMNDAHTAH